MCVAREGMKGWLEWKGLQTEGKGEGGRLWGKEERDGGLGRRDRHAEKRKEKEERREGKTKRKSDG